jgi:hypothetical protein
VSTGTKTIDVDAINTAEIDTAAIDTTEIDSVIQRVGDIVDQCGRTRSRNGYFAALYAQVTRAVKAGIESGRFDDGKRMSHFDRLFAEHYLRAFEARRAGTRLPESWLVAFDCSERWRPIVLQHLLVGMNAHINLDLGIAVTEVSPGEPLENLRHDYDVINAILAEILDRVQVELATISPWVGALDRLSALKDEALVQFSVEAARDGAWHFAERLAAAPVSERPALIRERDTKVAAFGRRIARPGLLLSAATGLIRLTEPHDPLRVIEALS